MRSRGTRPVTTSCAAWRASTTAGNPWNARSQSVWDATPEEREAEFEARYAVGGFCLHSAYRDLFEDPAANELLAEFLRQKIRERVRDPEVAELLCPYDHPVGAKRMCVDTGYFETFNRPNVRLVSIREHPIDEISESGGCASATRNSRSTRSCSEPASMR